MKKKKWWSRPPNAAAGVASRIRHIVACHPSFQAAEVFETAYYSRPIVGLGIELLLSVFCDTIGVGAAAAGIR